MQLIFSPDGGALIAKMDRNHHHQNHWEILFMTICNNLHGYLVSSCILQSTELLTNPTDR